VKFLRAAAIAGAMIFLVLAVNGGIHPDGPKGESNINVAFFVRVSASATAE
jgi:hypothetical protein